MLKLIKFLKPYYLSAAAALGLIFLQAVAELLLPTLMADIVDIGVVNGDIAYIFQVGGLMIIVTLAGTLCAVAASFLSARTATAFGRDLRSAVFRKVEEFSLSEFDRFGTSSLTIRTTNDITQIQQVVMMSMRIMARAPMMAVGGIIMAVSKSASLSVTIVFAVPVIFLAIHLVARKGLPLFQKIQTKLDRVNQVLRENLTGVRVIRAFNKTEEEKNRFKEPNRALTLTTVSASKIMAAMMPLMMLILNFTTIAVFWFGGLKIDQGTMQVGELMAFIQYVMQIMFSLIMVSTIFVMIPRASVSAARVNEVFDTKPAIKEFLKEQAGLASGTGEKEQAVSNGKGLLEFQNVTFSYPGAEKPVLKDISFTAEPGKVTAIIGSTGSGKSTLLNLIPRFYDPQQGKILLDGVDIKELPPKTLRDKIGYVPQKAVLFSGTIAENIRYGKEDATIEEIAAAAETAQAAEFINRNNGLEAPISQGGTNISGGQKQRLSIARALIRRPQILLFDDSFSALDYKTDARLRQALKRATAGATVLVVAQRVSTIIDADQIIVLDEGEIAGIGTHKELLKGYAVYREIVSSQYAEEIV
ncbi:MAG: ABC transporter ATP-binding protein [Dethiobacteria bacterium]|jgi:ATP-binding cassette subfamily B multidrug efflux pump